MGRPSLWTDKDLIEAVQSSQSIYEVRKKLGYKVGTGSGHLRVLNRARELGLDMSHFKKGHWYGDKFSKAPVPLNDLLVKDATGSANNLKRRLIREQVWEYKCQTCGISEWQGEYLPLEIHHMNNDNRDNRIENLTLLCPNCHAQTESWRNGTRYVQNKMAEIGN